MPSRADHHATDAAAVGLYLDLLKGCLTRLSFPERYEEVNPPGLRGALVDIVRPILARRDVTLAKRIRFDRQARETGTDWPPEAETMVGLARLNNLEDCIRTVVAEEVEGDLIETGVWRGGSAIFMRAVLAALEVHDRVVWVADSFAGLPPPDPAHPVDQGDQHHRRAPLVVPLEEVRANFLRYGLLDDQVRFLEGWFKDTLPDAPIERLSIIRLDGDMYGSTIDALTALYPRLAPGGFVIVDDYALIGAREAVGDFRREHMIQDPIEEIDWTGAFWRRSR